MAEIWFGIGDHEFQMDLRGPGLILAIPKPGVLIYKDEHLQPSGEEEDSWEFDLSPRDKGEPFQTFRTWEYTTTFLKDDPTTEEVVECSLQFSMCREETNVWGICIYTEGTSGHIIVLPGEVTETLEEAYAALSPEGWAMPPYVLRGGLHEETG